MAIRTTLTLGAALVATLAGFVSLDAQRAPAIPAPAKTRIGVFDSRMVALAYYNSEPQRTAMQRMAAEAIQPQQ